MVATSVVLQKGWVSVLISFIQPWKKIEYEFLIEVDVQFSWVEAIEMELTLALMLKLQFVSYFSLKNKKKEYQKQ